MNVSFELPQNYLVFDTQINDYAFILPSFYIKNPIYKAHYLNKPHKFSIMDCGIFEGDTFSNQQLISILEEINPNIFVVPDSWNDADLSFEKAKEWIQVKNNTPSIANVGLMAVIQCTDFKIGSELYKKYIDIGYNHISFNHSSTAYSLFFPHADPLISKMMGRIYFINQLIDKGVIDNTKYHHLLGASDWKEFGYYRSSMYNFIRSMDTSCPIINALDGNILDPLKQYIKPINKLEHYMNREYSQSAVDCLYDNVNILRKLIE